jgi:transposase
VATDDQQPAYEDVVAENDALREEVVQLRAALQAMEVELEKLRRESSRNSANSGKPPSSDTVTQRAVQNTERLSRQQRRQAERARLKEMTAKPEKRKPGKQPGAPGSSLAKAVPDHIEVHSPSCCRSCGESLAGAEVVSTDARQVHDLPVKRLEVTEHIAETRLCGCGQATKAAFPQEARSPVSYGPLLRAVAVYLTVFQHVPVARAAKLLADVCGAPVSTGFVAGLADEAAAGLDGFLDELRRQLRASEVLHADETGARISGARHWFHVACTDLLTLLDCHEKRGAEAFADIGVFDFFSGILISDGWKSYWSTGSFEHALCCAHLLRDLAGVAECQQHKAWADDMADLLVEAKSAVEAALRKGNAGLGSYQLQIYRSKYTRILNRGLACVPAKHRSGTVHRDAYNLLMRFDAQRHEIQRHWADGRVSFDNNQAERDLRMVKLQQKVSGCFRTMAGAKAFCAIRSYIHTAQKHGAGQLDVLVALFKGTPWMPPTAVSSP